jgi:hypothetical protein
MCRAGDGRESATMEESDFTHPGLRMIREPRAFTVILPVKAQRFRRLLHVVWFVVWLAGEAALIASLLGWQRIPAPPKAVAAVFLTAFTVAGAFVLYRLLWYLAGREEFVATGDRLRVRRQIVGFGHTRTFERRTIRKIRGRRLNYEVVYPSWGRMFIGHGEGEILIETDGAAHAYGKGLEEEEARILGSLLQQEMAIRSADRRPSEVRA